MYGAVLWRCTALVWLLAVTTSCSKAIPIDAADQGKSTTTSTDTAKGSSLSPAGEILTPEEEKKRAANGECVSMNHCPKFDPDVTSFGFTQFGLRGFVDSPVPWLLNGVDKKSDKRRVGVLVNNIPTGAMLIPADRVDINANIDWTPREKIRSVQKLEIYMRDLDRCEIEQAQPDVCYAYNILEDYDVKATVNWEITSKVDLAREADSAAKAKEKAKGDKKDIEWPPASEKCKASKKKVEGRLSDVIQGAASGLNNGELLSQIGTDDGC